MRSCEHSTTSIDFAEFFSGIGLVRMGLEAASPLFRCAFANDLDDAKRSMYASHFGLERHLSGTDVHELTEADIPPVDLATASFPCTDLSLAGGRKGLHKGESSAFWGFHNVLRAMAERRPPVVLLENVIGLLTSNRGADFLALLSAMNQLGYSVDPFVLDAKWFVPQSRLRLFVVCSRTGPQPDRLDAATLEASRLRPPKLVEFITAHASAINWSLTDLPEPPGKTKKTIRGIIRDPAESSPAWWSDDRVEYLLNQMFDRHLEWITERKHADTYQYATAFRRVRPVGNGKKRSMAELRTDGIAGCLRTPKGGSGRQILVRVGRGSVHARLLSPKECAALMGAPRFCLSGTQNQSLFGFGDAVCVDAIKWIANNYLLRLLGPAPDTDARYASAGHELAEVSP